MLAQMNLAQMNLAQMTYTGAPHVDMTEVGGMGVQEAMPPTLPT